MKRFILCLLVLVSTSVVFGLPVTKNEKPEPEEEKKEQPNNEDVAVSRIFVLRQLL